MSNYIQFYEDSACTRLWRTVPCDSIVFDEIGGHGGQPGILTVGGKTYNYYDSALPTLFYNVQEITSNPFLTFNRPEETRTVYCKNGFSMRIGSDSNRTTFSDFKYNGEYLPFDDESAGTGRYWAIAFFDTTTNKNYVGFTRQTGSTWEQYIPPIACIEIDFWNSAFRPSYDYGTGTDADGGQGSGKIPHTDIPLTATPSKIVPIGGRGLHAYRINALAYGSLQGYLWGDSSTLAKSLWQKFNNKTHNPVSCIVGCFSLPEDFMPTGSGNTGINIAGLYLSPISGTCVSVGGSIGFVDKTITFGAIEPPFHNFLDYTAITCKIHVPFCGEMAIAPEQIIGSDLTLRYRVDQLNGNIVAAVKANGIVLGELSGNCAYNIPLTGGDDGTLQRLGAITSGITAVVQDNVQGAMVAMQNGMNAGFSAQLVNSDLHGSTTACENRVPYLVWTYSGTAYTPDYAQAQGVPCEFSGNLAAFSGGYGEFEIMSNSPALQLVYDVMGATETEKQEIAALLRNGVII